MHFVLFPCKNLFLYNIYLIGQLAEYDFPSHPDYVNRIDIN